MITLKQPSLQTLSCQVCQIVVINSVIKFKQSKLSNSFQKNHLTNFNMHRVHFKKNYFINFKQPSLSNFFLIYYLINFMQQSLSYMPNKSFDKLQAANSIKFFSNKSSYHKFQTVKFVKFVSNKLFDKFQAMKSCQII